MKVKSERLSTTKFSKAFFIFSIFTIIFSVAIAIIDRSNSGRLISTDSKLLSWYFRDLTIIFPSLRAVFMIIAFNKFNKCDPKFRVYLLYTFFVSLSYDVFYFVFCSSVVYSIIRFILGTTFIGLWLYIMYCRPLNGFKNQPDNKEKVYFNGLMLLLAFWLFISLYRSLNEVLEAPLNLNLHGMPFTGGFDYYASTFQILYFLKIIPFAIITIWATYLFFQRKKTFKPVALVLAFLHVCYYTAINLTIGWNYGGCLGKLDYLGTPWCWEEFSLEIVVIFIILYLPRLNTYLTSSSDIYSLSLKQKDEPLPIYGFVILLGMQAAYLIWISYIESCHRTEDVNPEIKILFFTAFFILSIWCYLLFFQRKRLFKLLYFILASLFITFILINRIPYWIYYTDPFCGYNEGFSYLEFNTDFMNILYQIALVVYIPFSKRVKRTFVY